MHSSHKSVFVSAGLLLLISAMVHAAKENDILNRFKRDSEAESDGEEEVYDNIYSALSDPAAREKRQNIAGSRIQSQQQSRDGKQSRSLDNRLESPPPGYIEDMIMEPSIRHTASIGYRQQPLEDGFVPSTPEFERFPRATVSPTVSSTPRIFQELVELISPPFQQQQQHPQPVQHNNNFRTTTNNNFPQSFSTSSPNHFSNNPNAQFNSNSFNNNNNNNKFIQTAQPQNNFIQNQLNSNGFGQQQQQVTRPLVQSSTPFPPTSSLSPSLSSSAASPISQIFSQNLSQKPERLGKLKTGNGQPVQQSSNKPNKSKKKKSNKNKKDGNNNNNNDSGERRQQNLFGVVVDGGDEQLRRQGKQQKQPPLTFVTSDLVGSPSSSSVSKLLGRQVKNAIPGFPTGLPSQVPEGVRIALESAQIGPDGEFIMNPIPGQAGVDFPVLAAVPTTNFDCNAQKFPGIYSDVDADCQVFHMCQPNGNSDSFLCPNGTVFNQQYFICDWWYNVDCSANPSFYGLNEFIYQDQPEGKKCKSLFCSEE